MADSHRPAAPSSPGSGEANSARREALSSDQITRLTAALEEAFTLDGLRQLLREGFEGLSLNLDAVVPVPGRTLRDICHDLVLWALHDERVGLQGLLAAAVRCNTGNPQLAALEKEWAGVTFTRPACPYPGMKAFTASERQLFFGRDGEIAQAVDRLRHFRFLAIVGPSGSGKSSLLAAGILPAVISSHHFACTRWVVQSMRPGTTPHTTLLSLLATAPTEQARPMAELPAKGPETCRLLVIDQYEELFTTAEERQRKLFEQDMLNLL